jgi:hypothetical protein
VLDEHRHRRGSHRNGPYRRREASVCKFNDNVYEATLSDAIISIATDPSNGELMLSDTGRGDVNGISKPDILTAAT